MTRDALINQEVRTEWADETKPEAPFMLCEAHNRELHAEVAQAGFRGQLKARFNNDVMQAHLGATHALFTLASKTLGTETLRQHRCPVCAFKEFDFIKAIAESLEG